MNSDSSTPLPRGKVIQKANSVGFKTNVFGTKLKQKKLTKQKKEKKISIKTQTFIKSSDYNPGCIVLCSIISFQPEFIYVELPGKYRGVIKVTEISDPFYERLKNAVENEEDDLPDPESFLKVGDFLVACVVSNGTKPIELTLRPNIVNSTVQPLKDTILTGAVMAEEDKGYIVDIGFNQIKGFLPYPKHKKYSIGQILFVTVVDDSNKSFVRLNTTPKNFFPSIYQSDFHYDYIRPTHVYDGVITCVYNNGARQIAIGKNTVMCSRISCEKKLDQGSKVRFRPIFVDPAQKSIWVSVVETIVEGVKPKCSDIKIGSKHTTKVSWIRSGVGIESIIEECGVRVFIDFAESNSDSVLLEGDDHFLRITGRSYIDDVLFATDDPDVINIPFFCSEDVHVGTIVDATVSSVNPNLGVFVKLSPFLRALCYLSNVENIKSLKKGDNVECVVISVKDNHVNISLKQKLIQWVKEGKPIIKSTEDAKHFHENSIWTKGFIKSSRKRRLIVEFFNGIVGLIHASHLPVQTGTDIRVQYPVGHIIETLVSGVSGELINCTVTNDKVIRLGEIINVTVLGRSESVLRVQVPSEYGKIRAVIPRSHFSECKDLSNYIFKTKQVGDVISASVLRYSGSKAPLVLTCKKSFIENSSTIPKDLDEFQVGNTYIGYINSNEAYGSFVSYYGRASGLLYGMKYDDGETVNLTVEGIDSKNRARLVVHPELGLSEFFLKCIMDDISQFYGELAPGAKVQLPESSEVDGEFFVYKTDSHTFLSPSQLDGQNVSVIYHDILSKRIFVDIHSKKTIRPKVNDTLTATVVASFFPIFVLFYKGRYFIAPMINFNNKNGYSQHVEKGKELSIKITDNTGSVYWSVPDFLNTLEINKNIEATLKTISEIYAFCETSDGLQLKVHRSQLSSECNIGDQIYGTVYDKKYFIANPDLPLKQEDFVVGRKVIGVVKDVYPGFLILSLSPYVNGIISSLNMIHSNRSMKPMILNELYTKGMLIECYVCKVTSKRVYVSSFDPNMSTKVKNGRVWKIKTGDYASIKMGDGSIKKLDVCDVTDEFIFNPLSKLRKNSVIDVVEVEDGYVSTKQSDFEENDNKLETVVGQVYKGYISGDINGALLVRLARNVTVRLPYGNIAECFLKEAGKVYPRGSLVTVKVLDISDGRVTVTSKKSEIENREPYTISDLKVGDHVDGFITNAKDIGVFITLLDYQKVSGLAHRSNVEGDPLAYLQYVNKKIVAEIMNVDLDKSKVSFKIMELTADTKHEIEEDVDEPDEEPTPFTVDVNWEDESEVENVQESKKRKKTEDDVRTAELEQLAGRQLTTIEDFEEFVSENQEASFSWIKYIEFLYANGSELDAIEKIITRALIHIDSNDLNEIYNIMVVKIRLYVNRVPRGKLIDTLKPIVEEANQRSDNPYVWVEYAKIVSEIHVNDLEIILKVWQAALRAQKDGQQKLRAYNDYIKYLISSDQVDKALEQIEVCKKNTFKDKEKLVIKLTRYSALNLFRYNHKEQARTLFTNLVDKYPENFEIWNEYVEAEVQGGDVERSRQLFEKIANLFLVTDYNPKFKSLLERWREFEIKNGKDPTYIKKIGKIAKDYKEKHTT